MNVYRIVWEDEAKAREVELQVDYTVAGGTVQIDAIRPAKVTFYNAQTKTAVRSMGIYTETGRKLLANAYLASRAIQPTLETEIYSQLAERDGAHQVQGTAC